MNDFADRTIPVFPDLNSGVRLVDVTTGEEIKPGQTIPEPYGHGHITYLSPTVHTREADTTPRAGRIAVVRYTTPATDWAFRPAELNARYEDTTPPPRSPPADPLCSSWSCKRAAGLRARYDFCPLSKA